MPNNEFLPIAVEGIPNVASQADYAASRQQQQGFAVGEIPTSPVWNKMLRQSSSIAALLSAWLVNQTGDDMLDNGDQASKLSTFNKAVRAKLTGNLNLYVRADGNNANSGLVNNAGGAFLTVQYAVAYVAKSYDPNGFQIIVNLQAGQTFAGNINPIGLLPGQNSPIVINGGGNTTILSGDLILSDFAWYKVQNLKSNGRLAATEQGILVLGAGMELGASAAEQVASTQGALVQIQNNIAVSGGALSMISADGGRIYIGAITWTFTNAPGYGTAVVGAINDGTVIMQAAPTYTNGGTVTGKRYQISNGSFVNTGGAAIPGNAAGTVDAATGGFIA